MDIVLVVGMPSDSVVVNEAPPVIDTESGHIAKSLSYHDMINVVQNGRSAFNYLLMSPGVMRAGAGYNINGNRGTANDFTIDGISTNDPTTREGGISTAMAWCEARKRSI